MTKSEVIDFRIEEHTGPDGLVRLLLLGELDLAVAPALAARLQELRETRSLVCLDLSELRFMDSTGLGTVLTAVLEARREGWALEVDRRVARPVQRIVELAGVAAYLWPDRTV